MPTYILFTKLTTQGVRTLKENPNRLKEVNEEMSRVGIQTVHQYAALGPYHFINIVEAENEQAIARAALELGSRGTAEYEIVPAMPVDDLLASFGG